jgi:hypothetical protein
MHIDYKSKLKLSLRRVRQLWKHRWADWGPRPLNGGRQFVPPGHFYSPIPALDDIRGKEDLLFGNMERSIRGIDMHEAEQLVLLDNLKPFYKELPFGATKTSALRYFFDNPAYSYSDAIFLYSMIRHAQPARIIEIGCGYSSCLMLDTNDLFFNRSIEMTFIDPNPEVLLSLLQSDDEERVCIIPTRIQDIEVEMFESLQSGDILFIDSTHVSKVFSDVNRLFFEILPCLARGVFIHLHDIFYPFEYPKEWIYEGRAWTEAYLLRAFLQYNNCFRVILMNTFLEHYHREFFEESMPLCLKNPGGSIWIRKECNPKL